MADEPKGEAAVEGAAAVATAEPTKPAEQQVDWKAQAEQAQAQAEQLRGENAKLAKLAEAIRGNDLNLLRQKEQGDLIRQLAEGQRLMVEAVKTQDWDAYNAKMQEIAANSAKAQIAAANEQQMNEAANEITALEQEIGRDFAKDAAFEDARLFWRNGQYVKAANEAHKVAVRMAKEQTAAEKKATAKAVADAVTKTKKETEESLGKFDLSAGAEAGGGAGSPTLESLAAKDTRRMTPKELREHDKLLDAAIRRQSRAGTTV